MDSIEKFIFDNGGGGGEPLYLSTSILNGIIGCQDNSYDDNSNDKNLTESFYNLFHMS